MVERDLRSFKESRDVQQGNVYRVILIKIYLQPLKDPKKWNKWLVALKLVKIWHDDEDYCDDDELTEWYNSYKETQAIKKIR